MPDFKSLLKVDSSRVIADQVVDAIGDNPVYFKTVLDLCFSEGYPIAMRAGRAVALSSEKYPELIIPYIDQLIKMIAGSKIDGVKRGILQAFYESVDMKQFSKLGELVDLCFSWLMNLKESIAVRYYAMLILNKVCLIEPDLKNELIPVLEGIAYETSAGLTGTARKLLKNLSMPENKPKKNKK
jgi:hypothetical protein